MAPRSAAMKLRESFGDRKLPDISRRITACVACRKLKIKCVMDDSGPPCERCKSHKAPCTVNKSLQMLLENDAVWQANMEARIARIEMMLDQQSTSSQRLSLPMVLDGQNETQLPQPTPTEALNAASSDDPRAPGLDTSISLGAYPGSSITDLTPAAEFRANRTNPDLVDRGVLSLQQAEQHFAYYQENLDEHVYYVLENDDNLDKVRQRSSMLLAAICAVSASCNGTDDYEASLNALKAEASSKLFARRYSFDDVRALCITVFWLTDVAVALSSLAVRIGTQLDLHRCVTKMPHSKRECYIRTRLFYLVCICDHQCSLIFGRPPSTTDLRSLKLPSFFLNSRYSTRADIRMIAHLELCSTMRKCFDTFGADIHGSIVTERSLQFDSLNEDFKAWHAQWYSICVHQEQPDGLTNIVCNLNYQSAKLFLFTHVFRDLTSSETSQWTAAALESALSVISCICVAGSRSQMLLRLAWQLQAMIAFALIILLRSISHPQAFLVDRSVEARDTIQSFVDVLGGLDAAQTRYSILRVLFKISDVMSHGQTHPVTRTEPVDSSGDADFLAHPMDLSLLGNDFLNFDLFDDTTDWASFFTQNGCGRTSHLNEH